MPEGSSDSFINGKMGTTSRSSGDTAPSPSPPSSIPDSPTDSVPSSRLSGPNLSRFNVLNGDDRRNSLSSRYWRFREWSRQAALNVPADLPEDPDETYGHKPRKNKKCYDGDDEATRWTRVGDQLVENEKKEEKDTEVKPPEGVETPPGFRWVYVEIV